MRIEEAQLHHLPHPNMDGFKVAKCGAKIPKYVLSPEYVLRYLRGEYPHCKACWGDRVGPQPEETPITE